MSDLSVFFAQNVAGEVTEEVAVSARFRNKDGSAVLWKLRSMTEDENEQCRKAATRRVKGKNGQYTQETNTEDYLANLVSSSVVFPDLKNPDLQRSYGVLGAESLLRKMLLPGEYVELVQHVQRLNGFDQDVNELVEQVKKLIQEGDGEANYAYYALHELRILPHELTAMSRRERAAIYAMIDVRVEQERKERKKMKK